MGKSRSEKHIDSSLKKALGINEELNQLDEEAATDKSQEEIDQEKKSEERKQMAKELKEKLSKLKKKESKDKEFCREMYKELAARGMTMLAVMQEEVELNPRARDMETAGGMINSISSTLDSLRNIDDVDEKFSIEREKIAVKKQTAIGNERYAAIAAEGTKAVVSTMADMVKEIRKAQADDEEEKTIDVEVDVEESEEDAS